LKFIDFHVHFWKKEFVTNAFKEMLRNFAIMMNLESFPNANYTPENYLKAIEPEKDKDKEHSIEHALIFPVDYSFTNVKFKISYRQYLDYIIKVCDEYKGTFSALVGPDPRHGVDTLELIDYAIGQCGFKGLLLSPSMGFALQDPMIYKMIQKVEQYKVPIIIHDSGLVPRPLELLRDYFILDELLSKFPNQLFIFSPFSQMTMSSLMQVAIRHADHLMTDITGYDSQFIGRKMPEMVMTQFFGMLKETFGSDKLLFGSDWPWWELSAPILEWHKYVRKMKVPLIVRPFGFPNLEDEDKENIMGLNAQRILNL